MVCRLLLAGVVTLAAGGMAWAEETGKWNFRREVALPPQAAGGEYGKIVLPAEVLGQSGPEQADLRLVDHAGREVPYAREEAVEATARSWPGGLLNQGLLADGRRTVVIDTGPAGERHRRVALELSGIDYLVVVTVEGADQLDGWVELTGGVLLDRPQRLDYLEYGPAAYRYLRLTLAPKRGNPGTVQAVRVFAEGAIPAERPLGEPWVLTGAGQVSADGRAQVWQGDLPWKMPLAAVSFNSEAQLFERRVTVSVSDDGKQWREAGQGLVYRYAGGREALTVRVPPVQGRYWQVKLFNEQDQPLLVTAVNLHPPAAGLIFPLPVREGGAPDGRLFLYYGGRDGARTAVPQYDLAGVLRHSASPVIVPCALGEPETLPGAKTGGWAAGEHPGIMTAVLIFTVLVLGGLLYRTFRQ
ncbi:MAG: DUF3999 family protein, partial [Heliobacteriaceae bacterium]|nr:DUF3999 family protein [Heliobacteriaceae bacterium]